MEKETYIPTSIKKETKPEEIKSTKVQTLGAVNGACAVLLIDGLGLFTSIVTPPPLVASGESDMG